MIVKTKRFGEIVAGIDETIQFPLGILGFPDRRNFCLIDPNDDTLILWLQSLEDVSLAFPVLEPRIFRPDYSARLSQGELRELKLESVNQSAVFAILTIPEDVTQMTANLKAPLVVNLREHVGRQVVLQENEFGIRSPMFKELRAHLATIRAQRRLSDTASENAVRGAPVPLKSIPPSLTVKAIGNP